MAAAAVIATFIFVDFSAAVSQQKTFGDGQKAAAAFVQALREDNKEELLLSSAPMPMT